MEDVRAVPGAGVVTRAAGVLAEDVRGEGDGAMPGGEWSPGGTTEDVRAARGRNPKGSSVQTSWSHVTRT